ncbi:DUF805 domain-containing protein [Maricaulis sp.]|uniref:DUF805 domain-containing protein n=1 Tax=Maricaulis sp. TaxID=1486257 RepID=UPI0026114850|nr:DUF805 domain-containing protein [Maricaulis sp.]
MGFFDAIKSGFSNYVNFQGRARRSEYWFWVLFTFIASVALTFLDMAMMGVESFGVFSPLFSLAVILPSIAVAVRRLHDSGKSGWWILIGLIPLVGFIVLIIFYVSDSAPGSNQYGPNPKGLDSAPVEG